MTSQNRPYLKKNPTDFKKFHGRCQIVGWEGLPSFTSMALFVFELSRIFGRGGGVKRPPPGQARVNIVFKPLWFWHCSFIWEKYGKHLKKSVLFTYVLGPKHSLALLWSSWGDMARLPPPLDPPLHPVGLLRMHGLSVRGYLCLSKWAYNNVLWPMLMLWCFEEMYNHDPPPPNIDRLSWNLAHASFWIWGKVGAKIQTFFAPYYTYTHCNMVVC